ncbi:MAG: MltA domain-containing protein [Deltaproteobacteria bacterium]|nr:MltA domain-containing protein [Deltaproteobacteria bacterium]
MNTWVNKRYNSIIVLAVLFSLLFAGCAVFKKGPPRVRESALIRIESSDYPEFSDDMDYDGLEHGVLQSILYLNKVPADRTFRFGKDVFDAAHMIRSMEHFLHFIQTKPSKQQLRKYISSNYLVYKSVGSGNPGQVLFTGYYEPLLEGSIEKSTEYRFPIYARPSDLTTIDLSLFLPAFKGKKIIGRYTDQTVVPYYDRKDIEYKGALEGKTRAIAWLKDRVDLFFLQIQGSGKIYLNNDDILHVHYHGTNGRPYRSIGKLLIDKGKIPREEMSMQKIRAYLYDYPEEAETVLNYNPSYVFFKIEEDGPIGYLEVKLTPGRSIALDRRLFPLAGLAFIKTDKPLINSSGKIHKWSAFSRFVLNQDTGGAIKGPGRGDLFWGDGTYAEIAAGHMQHHGTLYFLVLKPDVL